MFGIGQNEVVGLDIGTSSVKLVQVRRNNGGYAVTAAAITDIKYGLDGSVKGDVTAAIRRCFAKTFVQTRYAVCGLRGQDVMVMGFKFPPIPQNEVAHAVAFEAQQVCPIDIKKATLDYQVIKPAKGSNSEAASDKSVKGVLVVAANEAIHNKTKLVKDASARCVLMDLTDFAALNCFMESEKPETASGIALLDVGNSFSSVSILGYDGIPFIRTIGFGGDEIIKRLAEEEGVSEESISIALSPRRASGEAHGNISFALAGNLKAACGELVVWINETLRYYLTQVGKTPVNKIYVCGGFAMVNGFADVLKAGIPVEILVWNPFLKMQYNPDIPGGELLRTDGPALAVSAGLAMRLI